MLADASCVWDATWLQARGRPQTPGDHTRGQGGTRVPTGARPEPQTCPPRCGSRGPWSTPPACWRSPRRRASAGSGSATRSSSVLRAERGGGRERCEHRAPRRRHRAAGGGPVGRLGVSRGGRTRGAQERATRDGAQGPSVRVCHPDEEPGLDAGSLGTSRPLLLGSSEPLTTLATILWVGDPSPHLPSFSRGLEP